VSENSVNGTPHKNPTRELTVQVLLVVMLCSRVTDSGILKDYTAFTFMV
jgi:hypothetical protein